MKTLNFESLNRIESSIPREINTFGRKYLDVLIFPTKNNFIISIPEAQSIAENVFFSSLMNLTTTASNVIKKGYTYVQNIPTFNFEFYENEIDNDLKASNALLGNVTRTGQEVRKSC